MDEEKPIVSWVPNIYPNIPKELQDAIDREVASYNLPSDKAYIVAGRVKAAITARYQFDSAFTASYASASPSAKQKIIRDFLRSYVQKEISLETENIKREVSRKVLDNKEGIGTLDPRGKEYESYRKNLLGFIFPDAEDSTRPTSDDYSQSDYKSSIDKIVKDHNDGKITTAAATAEISRIESAVNSHLDDRFFNPVTGNFESHYENLVSSRVDAQTDKKFKFLDDSGNTFRSVNPTEKAKIVNAALSGDVKTLSKYGKKRKDAAFYTQKIGELTEKHTVVKINPATGKMSVSGDGFKEGFSNNLASATKLITDSNPIQGIRKVRVNHLAANIADLAHLSATTSDKALASKANSLLERSKLASDILNIAEATRHIGKLNVSAVTKLGAIKSRVEAQVLGGAIAFKNDAERDRFLDAIRNDDSRYLDSFTKPGIIGNSTFSGFLKATNEGILDVAGEAGSQGMASRVLNYANREAIFKKQVVNSWIYAAQLAYDPGYLYKEVKAKISNYGVFGFINQVDKKFKESDVKESLTNFAYYALGKAGVNTGSVKSLAESFKRTPGENLKRFFSAKITAWLKKKGVDITAKFLNSYFVRNLKLKAIKNLRYLEELLKIGVRKIGGPLGSALSRALAKGFSRSGGIIGSAFAGVSSYISKLLGSSGSSSFLTSVKRFIIATALILLLTYIIGVFSIVLPILGAFSSNSSTPYLPGTYSDVTFGTFESYTQNLAFLGGRITTSGNVCLEPSTSEMFEPGRSNWNNLKVSDFDGVDNTNNCKIMCNARKIMAGLMPGKDGNLNCNYNFPQMYKYDNPEANGQTQFWCTQLIMNSYKDDDPGIQNPNNALVITMDSYLKGNPKYKMSDLAIPNDPTDEANLSVYRNVCVDRANFQAGNIVIFRQNTCNDTGSGSYKTKTGYGVVSETSGHVEMVLKLSGDSLVTISSNNVLKKLTYAVSGSGCPSGKVKVIGTSKVYLTEGGVDVSYPLYLCRMYQYENPAGGYACPSKCEIPANNYPDR